MWLKSMTIENFRGFEKLEVTFDRHTTLLLGGNGAGKTSLLEAITVAYGSFMSRISQGPNVGITTDHVRRVVFEKGSPPIPDLQEQWPVSVSAVAALGPLTVARRQGGVFDEISWERGREDRAGRTSRADDSNVREVAERVQDLVMTGQDIDLPIIAYYGTGRQWREKRATAAKQGIGNRLDAYVDCLDIASSERFLHDWMRRRTYEEVQKVQATPTYRHPQLQSVVAAVEACITGVTNFEYDIQHEELRLRVGSRFQSFGMLSDGYRNMIAMVADIAERAAVLNPHFGVDAAARTAGVVLIDEIELHLHPKWQRTVIPSLRRTFPNMQFIATTHSPQVLSTVERHQVRLFEHNQLVAADLFVEGRASNELLEDIFGVPARPDETKAAIADLCRMIDDSRYEDARAEVQRLEAVLGPSDPDLVRVRWLIETEDAAAAS